MQYVFTECNGEENVKSKAVVYIQFMTGTTHWRQQNNKRWYSKYAMLFDICGQSHSAWYDCIIQGGFI